MSLNNTHVETIIPTMEITTFHTDEEPKVHIENYFDIVALKKKVGLNLNEILLFSGARLYFNEPQLI